MNPPLTPHPSPLRGEGSKVLLSRRLSDARELMPRGILTHSTTGLKFFTGYSYATLYDWDQYFEAIACFYFGWPVEYALNGVHIFLDSRDRRTGFITRCVPTGLEGEKSEHVKPFLGQLCCMIGSYTGRWDFLTEELFAGLTQYLDYWLTTKDPQNIGLSVWDSGPHTGMDNQQERAGFWKACFAAGVDLNCFLVRELRAQAHLAEKLNKFDVAAVRRAQAEQRAESVRTQLWDDQRGYFYDLDIRTGKHVPVTSSSGFSALWAGVATPAQARRMVSEHLLNPAEFWRAHPIPSLAATEPGYSEERLYSDVGCNWRACTWIPVNYYTCQGLRQYGYHDVASILAERTVRLIDEAGLREWYTSDTGRGQGLDPFWGWSVTGLFLPFEEEAGFDPTTLPADGDGWPRVSALAQQMV